MNVSLPQYCNIRSQGQCCQVVTLVFLFPLRMMSSWILASCQLHRVTSGWRGYTEKEGKVKVQNKLRLNGDDNGHCYQGKIINDGIFFCVVWLLFKAGSMKLGLASFLHSYHFWWTIFKVKWDFKRSLFCFLFWMQVVWTILLFFHSVQNLTWTVLVRLWHLLKFQFNLSVAEKVRFNQVCSECVPSSRFDRAGVKAKALLSDNCSQVQEISHSVIQSVLKLCYMVMVVFWKINLFTLCADVE